MLVACFLTMDVETCGFPPGLPCTQKIGCAHILHGFGGSCAVSATFVSDWGGAVDESKTLPYCRILAHSVGVAQRRLATRRFLATVLFTDIVGSTSRAAELGDRAWRDLLERHNAVVRRELRAFGGREMDTAGDGFFAVFETPE
jgi:hypothetical protein